MSKTQQLYVKHLYATSDEQEDDHSKMGEEVVINEISRKFENRYRDRRSDFRDSSQNRRDNYSQEARTNERRWQPYNNSLNSRQPRYQETLATIMQASRQTLTLRIVDSRVISLISKPDKRVPHHQLTGLWIQMIESTLQLVDQIDKKESKTQC